MRRHSSPSPAGGRGSLCAWRPLQPARHTRPALAAPCQQSRESDVGALPGSVAATAPHALSAAAGPSLRPRPWRTRRTPRTPPHSSRGRSDRGPQAGPSLLSLPVALCRTDAHARACSRQTHSPGGHQRSGVGVSEGLYSAAAFSSASPAFAG
eukprot:6343519-Prymnesium_polylepis.1